MAIPETLTALGVQADQIDRMAAMAIVDPTAGGNPVELTLEAATQLFHDCM
jgi:alcohol dehydrogenase class IV